jgi:hypothetical protein
MGLGSFLGGAKDDAGGAESFGSLLGGLSGETGAAAATEAADINNAELQRQFDLSQENLRPSLEAAQRQIPGIAGQLNPQGFEDNLGLLSNELTSLLGPTQQGRGDVGMQQLQQAGLNPSSMVRQDLSQIDPSRMADLLLGSEADLFSNRLQLSGLGEGAGTTLSELGQRTGGGMAQANLNAATQGQQAKAAGTQNAIGIGSLVASFMSDERLKKNIIEHGTYKGLRIISWDWKELVPEQWRNITTGFSAQDVLSKYPEFVLEKHGFLSIDRDNLINHLETI